MKFRSIFAVLILTALTLGACAPAVSDQDLQSTVEIAIALTALAETSAAPATASPPAPTAEATAEQTIAPATETPAGPEVVFLAEGSFSAEEKSQIMSRVVEPFILYYHDRVEHPALLTIAIEKYDGLAGYPYAAQAIFETGINTGWLVSASGGLVDWWIPDCMGLCPLSDVFRAAYPAIVAILEP